MFQRLAVVRPTAHSGDFDAPVPFTKPKLLELYAWREDEFLRRIEGSAIRRIGHQRWHGNLAVAMGNAMQAAPSDEIERALRERLGLMRRAPAPVAPPQPVGELPSMAPASACRSGVWLPACGSAHRVGAAFEAAATTSQRRP
jgi:hypothetical protein